MATEGSVYLRKVGRYCAQYTDATGKARYLYRKTKNEAKLALREALKDRDDGITPPSKITVAAMLDSWLEDIRDTVSYRTWINQELIVRRHLKPNIGATKLARLDARAIRGLYRDKLAEGLCSGTVKRIHTTLNQAMQEAVRCKYIRSNPLDDVRPPKEHRSEPDVLTPEQVLHLLEIVRGDRFEGVYVLGALCGLRIGEVLALRWSDFDLDRGTLTVRHTLWRGQTTLPKTPSSRRSISLPERALEALVRHSNGSDGCVFATRTGKPVAAHHFHKCSWRPMLAKAGMPRTLTFHKLRHGAASHLLNEHVPLPIVSRYLGHANPGITAREYAHVLDGTSHVAASAMDSLLSDE